jgi:hypothetical protein
MQISRSSSKRLSEFSGLKSLTPSSLRVSFPKLSKGRYSENVRTRDQNRISHEKETYSVQSAIHAGMKVKPLVPYKPECSRSRLLASEILMPHRNISSFMIGDKTRYKASKVFKTSYQQFCSPNENTRKSKNSAGINGYCK